jgi:hypothetical protein
MRGAFDQPTKRKIHPAKSDHRIISTLPQYLGMRGRCQKNIAKGTTSHDTPDAILFTAISTFDQIL